MVEIWFAIFWIMVAAYAVLEGRSLGAAALRLHISSSSDERRQVLDAIGPMWTFYEVWLIAAGGVLLLAFPAVLAVAFSGYYLALFLILWLLVLRGISMELGRHLDHPMWSSFWDFVLTASSALIILLLGVALGNVLRGAPLDEQGEFHMAFFTDFSVRGQVGLIDWYTLSVGLLALVGIGAHGAAYLTGKTSGIVRARSKAAGKWLWLLTVLLGIGVAIETWVIRPDLRSAVGSHPLSIACLLLAAGGAISVIAGFRSNRDGLAYAGSCVLFAAMLGAPIAAEFPVLIHSTLDPAQSVTAYQAASPHRTLVIGLAWWLVALPLVLTWQVLASRGFRGRVAPEPLTPLG